MATQFDPIAKDESLNTTESPSRNIADVLAEELSAIEQAIAGGSGSGGHTIVNASGTDMTQREKMQFVDAGVTDDSANNKTKVEIVQTISSEADLANAPDGVYQGTWDEDPEDILTADMVGYGAGTVKDALDGKITEAFRANATTIPANSSGIFDFTDSTKYTTRKAYLLFGGQAYQNSNSRICAIVLAYTSASILIPIFKDANITLTMTNGVLTVAAASQQTNVGMIDLGYFMG